MTAKIAIVIPTRNRPQLAMNAARSLLAQDCELDLFVSDNSASRNALRDSCRAEPRITLLQPPGELSMQAHWDWAIRQAMERSTATHFSVHYDRKYAKPGHWGRLAAFAGQWPDLLLAFHIGDFISDQPPPLRLWQPPWTGKMFLVESDRLIRLIAAGRTTGAAHMLPVLSNCVVPRAVLQSILDRFGNICDSTGADSAFLCRFLALHDRYAYYDRTQGILYASHRSNARGFLGGTGGDFADFMKLHGERPWLPNAPIPGMNLGQNTLYHEYELVRRETGDRLPPLDVPGILDDLAIHLRWVDDPRLKEEYKRILRAHGWRGAEPEPVPRHRWRDSWRQFRMLNRMKSRGERLPTLTGYAFRNDRQALKYALAWPREPQEGHEHLDIVEPVEFGAGFFDSAAPGEAGQDRLASAGR
jgi:hypothetical protein